jgi:undecaprenyl-diphosphatase
MNAKMKWALSGIFLALFGVLIVMIKKVDVESIGPEGTKIGLSGINKPVADNFTYNETWYKITQYLGYAALLVAGCLAVMGLVQLIQRKSLLKVDSNILAAGVIYVITIGLYFLFDKVVINYRPIILPDEGVLEAGFPSSHTMLSIVVFGTALLQLRFYVKNVMAKRCLGVALFAVMIVTIVGRLMSGAHWLTDICGGVLISVALLFAYSAAVSKFTEK